MEVEFESGGEIQTEGVAFDEEVRDRRNVGALTQHMTQMEQGNTKGCPAMPCVPFWPELLGEVLARMDAAFHRQIDEEREFLARGEQQHLISMAHFRWAQQCQVEVTHLTLLITLCCYHMRREDRDMRTDFTERKKSRLKSFKLPLTIHLSIIAQNTA